MTRLKRTIRLAVSSIAIAIAAACVLSFFSFLEFGFEVAHEHLNFAIGHRYAGILLAGDENGVDSSAEWEWGIQGGPILELPEWMSYGTFHRLTVPLVPAAVTALLLAGTVLRLTRETRKGQFCAKCGYDLRSSPMRCPECGHRSQGNSTNVRPECGTPMEMQPESAHERQEQPRHPDSD